MNEDPCNAIEIIEQSGIGLEFCLGNVIDYAVRSANAEDKMDLLRSMAWYANHAVAIAETQNLEPKLSSAIVKNRHPEEFTVTVQSLRHDEFEPVREAYFPIDSRTTIAELASQAGKALFGLTGDYDLFFPEDEVGAAITIGALPGYDAVLDYADPGDTLYINRVS